MFRAIRPRLSNHPRENWVLALSALIVYIASFGLLFGAAHETVTALFLLPLVVTGFLFGTGADNPLEWLSHREREILQYAHCRGFLTD